MAVTKAPLFSLAASGSIAKAICFSRWKGRAYVRQVVKPANPKTGLQVGMRASLKFNAQAYASLTAANKANWKAAAKKSKITPLDAQVRVNQTRARRNQGYTQDPTYVPAASGAAPTAGVVTDQPKSLVVTWTDSVEANDVCTFIYMSLTNGFTADISNLIAIIAHGMQTYTVPRLITGTPYYFLFKGSERGGTLSAVSGQITGTPT
jgi:hypothetical protein